MRKLGTILLALVFVLAFAPVASAQDQGSCANPNTDYGGASLRLWENLPTDTSDGNDTVYIFCHVGANASFSNLANLSHTPPGGCHSVHYLHGANWNDCVSSATVWLASSLWRACFFIDSGFRRLSYYVTGRQEGSRWDIPPDDETSSVLIQNDGTCNKY